MVKIADSRARPWKKQNKLSKIGQAAENQRKAIEAQEKALETRSSEVLAILVA